MTGLWHNDGSGWRQLETVPFENEAALHTLVEEAPQLLPLKGSPHLTVVGREVQLGSGYADLLGIESDGRLAIIEVKLARNPEARRAVIAQVLAYAAFLAGMSVEGVEQELLASHLHRRRFTSLAHAVQSSQPDVNFDPVEFNRALGQNLQEGRFRLVLVLDRAPQELINLVGYLEALTDKLVIDLLAVGACQVGSSQLAIPTAVVAERRTLDASSPAAEKAPPPKKPTEVEGVTDFRAGIENAPVEFQPELRRLCDWAQELEQARLCRPVSVYGNSRMILRLRLFGESSGLVALYNQNGASITPFRSVFERRAPETLALLDQVATIGNNNTIRAAQVTDEVLALLRSAYVEASGTQYVDPSRRGETD